MNFSRSLLLGATATILLPGAPTVARTSPQLNPARHHSEQTSFSVEFDFEHPVPVDQAAKEALATSPRLADDLKQKHLAPKDLPDRWFTASNVHLDHSGQIGLVVMGADGLLGANWTPFWVLRRTAKGYDLVLDTMAAGLDILRTETNGLRDIKTAFPTSVASWASNEFQFDGNRYRVAKRVSQTTGAKIPSDLTGYETHAPFVQYGAKDSSILSEARTWIWHHWKVQKPFYVTVVVQNEMETKQSIICILVMIPIIRGFWCKFTRVIGKEIRNLGSAIESLTTTYGSSPTFRGSILPSMRICSRRSSPIKAMWILLYIGSVFLTIAVSGSPRCKA